MPRAASWKAIRRDVEYSILATIARTRIAERGARRPRPTSPNRLSKRRSPRLLRKHNRQGHVHVVHSDVIGVLPQGELRYVHRITQTLQPRHPNGELLISHPAADA